MAHTQAEKSVVLELYRAIDAASSGDVAHAMSKYVSPDCHWRGYAPFYELHGADEIGARFWAPLKAATSRLTRRIDVFFAGENVGFGTPGVWVASMGHMMGLLDAPWLGIAPTGKLTFWRYAEFCLVQDGQITEMACYIDIPHVMMQTGLQPFAPQTGAHLVQPGPATHDGLLFDPQDPEAGPITMALIQAMCDDIGNWDSGLTLEDELRRTWSEDMLWWGPAGIGSTYTIERYAKQHSGPFRAGFADRKFNGHYAKCAEGMYGGFFGWPNFSARPSGGFMGMPETQKSADFRVIDIYRRDGDKLAENWIFIDMVHFWKQQGVDILERMAQVPRT